MKPVLAPALLVLALIPGKALAQTSGNTTGGITIGSGNTVTIGPPPPGSATSGVSGGGTAPVTMCGTVTALTSSSITLAPISGAVGSVTFTIPATVPVPTLLTPAALVCVLATGGTVTRFLSPCPGASAATSTGAIGSTSATTVGNLTLSGPVQIGSLGSTASAGVTVDLAGTVIAGTPVIVRGNVCSQVQVNGNSQTVVLTVTSAGAGPGSSCASGCVLVSPAGGNPGVLSSGPPEAAAVDSATVVHRIGLMVAF